MIKKIGPHRVQHGNIMNGVSELMGNDKADFIYSDPPWGQGNLRYWQTMNKKMTGADPVEIDYAEFLDVFFGIVGTYAKDTVLIEYGIKWRQDVIDLANRHGFKSGGIAPSIYGSKSKSYPLDIHVFSKSGKSVVTPSYAGRVKETMGFAVVEAAFDEYGPDSGIVLDPMCGMGYTAQASVDRGLLFRGNELNIKRLEKTIKRLERSL